MSNQNYTKCSALPADSLPHFYDEFTKKYIQENPDILRNVLNFNPILISKIPFDSLNKPYIVTGLTLIDIVENITSAFFVNLFTQIKKLNASFNGILNANCLAFHVRKWTL